MPRPSFTILKMATVPFAAFMWFLYYKSKKNSYENLLFIKSSNDSEKTTSAEGFKLKRVKVPQRAVGAVIGKEGMVIKRLQQMTRTTITFVDRSAESVALNEQKAEQESFWADDKEEGSDSLPKEELLIRGLSSNVDEAERKILEIIKSVPPVISEDMQVDKKFIGRIVGRNGDSIHKLRNTYRVRIDIERDNNCNNDSYPWRTLTIKGTHENVQSAKSAITCIVNECEEQLLTEKSASRNVKSIQSVTSTKAKSQIDDISKRKISSINEKAGGPVNFQSNGDVNSVVSSIDSDFPNLHQLSSAPISPTPDFLPQATSCIFPNDTNKWHKVMVSSVSNCANFFIHLVVPETRKLESLVQELTSHFSSITYHVKESDLYIGQIIAAHYPPDNTWQRARIVSFKEPSSRCSSINSSLKNSDVIIDVDYVDYGDCNSLTLDKVYPLVQKPFLEFPFQAIRVILYGIEPAEGPRAEWSEEAISYFEECVMGSQWQVLHARQVVSPLPGSTPFLELEDRRKPNNVINIAAKMVDSGYARWTPGCI